MVYEPSVRNYQAGHAFKPFLCRSLLHNPPLHVRGGVLVRKGIAGDVRSAELYLKATGQMASQQNINIKTETSVKELSDEELQTLIIEMSKNKINNKPIPDIEIVEEDA